MARPPRRAPEVRRALQTFSREHSRRESELEAARDALREERDEAIKTAYRGGLPMTEIAKVMRMSHQRVSQIVRGG